MTYAFCKKPFLPTPRLQRRVACLNFLVALICSSEVIIRVSESYGREYLGVGKGYLAIDGIVGENCSLATPHYATDTPTYTDVQPRQLAVFLI